MVDIENIKQKIVDRVTQLNPYKIILFGSYASGEQKEDSDLDICIVTKSNINKQEYKKKIRQLLFDIHMPKDILSPSLDEYEFYKSQNGSVYKDIDSKGIVLWSS